MIQQNPGGSTTITGGHIDWYALNVLLSGLKLEQTTGLRMSRHFTALAVAKQKLGLAPRKRLTYEKAIAAVEQMIADAKAKADAEEPVSK